jgi:nicotinate-nucleotide adenylyltransferase
MGVAPFPSGSGAKKLGILGGSFDPIHLGHIAIARQALGQAKLDHVILVPAWQSPHKSGTGRATPRQRLAMVEIAVGLESAMSVETMEIDRPGPSFSVETAERLQSQFPESDLFWILGSDQWDVLETWKDHLRLAELVTFLIFPRPAPGVPKSGIRSLRLDYRIDISSTEVREALRMGLPTDHLLDPDVKNYIMQNKLYQDEG